MPPPSPSIPTPSLRLSTSPPFCTTNSFPLSGIIPNLSLATLIRDTLHVMIHLFPTLPLPGYSSPLYTLLILCLWKLFCDALMLPVKYYQVLLHLQSMHVLNTVIVLSMDLVLVTSYRKSLLLQVEVLFLQIDGGCSLGDCIVHISRSPWEKTHRNDYTLEQYKIPKAY